LSSSRDGSNLSEGRGEFQNTVERERKGKRRKRELN